MKRRERMRERERVTVEEKEETEQPSKAEKGARQRENKTKKNTARNSAEKQAEASATQRESERRTWAGGGWREPVSTRQRKRLRVQLISASSSVAVINDLGGAVAALGRLWSGTHAGWIWPVADTGTTFPSLPDCDSATVRFIKSQTDEWIHQSLIAIHFYNVLVICVC